MPNDSASTDPLIASGDDDLTVARGPQAVEASGSAVSSVEDESAETGSPIDVDLASGSSLVLPGAGGSSVLKPSGLNTGGLNGGGLNSGGLNAGGLNQGGMAATSASNSTSGTAYFMKPMPQKHGSSQGPPSTSPAPHIASQLWQKLAVESDGEDGGSEISEPVRLEHFEVEKIIGRGGMGAVFLARDTRLSRPVALKILSPEHTTSQSSMDRFRNEARAAARLDHENIARVHYLGGQLSSDSAPPITTPALPFIAFEFVEGTNVRQLIRQNGPFSVADTVRIAVQLTNALRHTAACGVVHRDIKPSNVIITPSGRAKLVDLGLARTEDPDASRDLTVAGTTLGTFDYISPEQAKDPRTADIRSDIYSLGCTLFHMAVGAPPYPEGTMLQKLLDHQDRVVPDAHSLNRRVPLELSDLIKRMMDPQPQERPQSPDELLIELSNVSSKLGVKAASGEGLVLISGGRAASSLGWREHLGWVIAGSILALIVIFVDQIGGSPRATTTRTTPEASNDVGEMVDVTDLSASEADLQIDLVPGSLVTEPSKAPEPSKPISSQPEGMASTVTPAAVPGASNSPAVKPSGSQPVAPDAKRGAADSTPIAAEITADAAPKTAGPTELAKPYTLIQDGGSKSFVSLSEAIEEAPNGARIEVGQGGLIEAEEQFTRVTGKTVSIWAATGLKQRPVIRLVRPLSTPAAAIKLFQLKNSGSLAFYNLDFEIIVSRDAAKKSWNVFALEEGATVELENVSITVQNPTGADVSVFQTSAGMVEGNVSAYTSVKNCLVRGDTALIRADGICPLDADITTSAMALGRPLLNVVPSTMPMARASNNQLAIHFVNSTWVGSSNLVAIGTEKGTRMAIVQMDVQDGVFASLNRNVPLVAINGPSYSEELDSTIRWTGLNNFHSGDLALSIDSPDGEETKLSLDEWSARWSGNSTPSGQTVSQAVVGESTYPNKSLAEFDTDDFAPIKIGTNPILRGGSDGRPAGIPFGVVALPKPADLSR